eukprot:CAMPEP_0198457550 /NCGR_PEP_ID=MMETSP1453-20131121/30532_1 /TAXON_ID=1461543 ORGANISM="Unidentified sp., Strain RCC701" /NCGR_SAMPLE_ID=MMETSP1453 /ASSEMBLY_ACC=CAM_ASM_001118 /LENGTH=90 /DNA_ID=CAMNT_0044182285 /DNA_START=85 /DNA_END=354 /DNA_ORIENTATION=+
MAKEAQVDLEGHFAGPDVRVAGNFRRHKRVAAEAPAAGAWISLLLPRDGDADEFNAMEGIAPPPKSGQRVTLALVIVEPAEFRNLSLLQP